MTRHVPDLKRTRPGRRRFVDKGERLARRQAMHQLIAHAIPKHEVIAAMGTRYQMTKAATLRLHQLCIRTLAEDEAERRPHYKAQAIRRIHQHIRDARAAKPAPHFAAIAAFERLLAQIEGTLDAVEINVNLDATLRDSVTVVLGQMSAERLTQLSDFARQLKQLPSPEPIVVDVEAEVAAE